MIPFVADEVPGSHPTFGVCSGGFLCTYNKDTIISSAIAIVLTLAIAFGVTRRLRSGRPGKLQLGLELYLGYVRSLVHENVGDDAGSRYIFPISATIGMYILIANWLDFLPLSQPFIPPAADLNQTLAMAVVVIVVVQFYSVRVLGWRGFLRRFTKPFDMKPWGRALFLPLNIIEEVVKPITLSLRLFGNIFAGLVMVFLLSTKLPVGLNMILDAAWKVFDVGFIGLIQAFIFMLLTVLYFGMAREGLEEEEHHARAAAPATA